MMSFIMILLMVILANLISGVILMAIAFLIMLNPKAYHWMIDRCTTAMMDDDLLK